jgi:hypothetical protein
MCYQQLNLICQQERHVSVYRYHRVDKRVFKEDKMLITYKINNITMFASSLLGIPYTALQYVYIKIWNS